MDPEQYKYMVCTRCMTYNHEKYIKDALDGFAMQETTFPAVYVIVDDASTDSTADVIRRYMDEHFDMMSPEAYRRETDYAHIVSAPHQTNSNCTFVVLYLKQNHYSQRKKKMPYLSEWVDNSKYSAICEGDDYWIDPQKLQKQVDFLEMHEDYSLCFNSVKETYEGKPLLDRIRCRVENREYSGLEWYQKRPAQTASFVYRTSILDTDLYKDVKKLRFFVGDCPLLLTCAHYGKLRGFSDVMSVYRHNEGGWTSQKRSEIYYDELIESHLLYGVFGDEIGRASRYYYQYECVNAFVSLLRQRKLRIKYLYKAMQISFLGTFRIMFLRLRKQFRA